MARRSNLLTDLRVKKERKPGRYSDGEGLYLRVDDKGAKKWVFRYTMPGSGKPRETGFGNAGIGGVSLADARKAARIARERVRDGLDPIEVRKEERQPKSEIPTFGKYANDWIDQHEAQFTNKKHIAQWRTTLAVHAAGIARKPVDQITTTDVLGVLKPIWKSRHETATRLRGRIERILDAAATDPDVLRKGENPARWKGHLSNLLPALGKLQRGHHPAMSYEAVPNFLSQLRTRVAIAARALEFAILTAARSGEVRLARWEEIDFQKLLWTVPAVRMKAKREHRVPLTPRMVEILREVEPLRTRYGEESALVFPGQKAGKPLSDMTLTAVLKRMKVDGVAVHGFRSSFRDWAGEMSDFPREIAEAALAHVVGDATERAYRRGDALEKRRRMMEAWEAYCSGQAEADNVVALRA